MSQELQPAQIGQIGTALLSQLIGKLVDKGVLTHNDVTDLKSSVVKDAPKDLQLPIQTFLNNVFETTP